MSVDTLIKNLKTKISQFEPGIEVSEVGRVLEVGDGIARVSGLAKCQASEMIEFPRGTLGLALNLEEDAVGVVILGDYGHIHEGDEVRRTGRILSVPVSDGLLGRVVNPLAGVFD